ncbi:hypothetical protein FACS1894130_10960 [Spirochaetia bacterium]|nr:hypothetical protein FACS1894130_10960 [Spirochaetia bacterium]
MAAPDQVRKNLSPRKSPQSGRSALSFRTVLGRVCLLATAVILIIAGVLVFFAVKSGRPIFTPKDNSAGKSFSLKLREYDVVVTSAPGEDRLTQLLDDLEKDALGVESHLSVLKRRRALAIRAAAGEETVAAFADYLAAAERAAALFPHSQSLSAVAAEAAVRSFLTENPVRQGAATASSAGTASTRRNAVAGSTSAGAALPDMAPTSGAVPPLRGLAVEKAIRYAASLTDSSLIPLALSVYVLAGDLSDPVRAAEIPRSGELLSSVSEFTGGSFDGGRPITGGVSFREWENFLLDAAVLRLLEGDTQGTAVLIQPLINSRSDPETVGPAVLRSLRFGAEFFYDFGDPRRAAEIFAWFGDDRSRGREADALWLAGQQGPARTLWTLLTSPDSNGYAAAYSDLLVRCLYNLASTEQSFIAERQAKIAAEKAASGAAETPEETFSRLTAVTTPEKEAAARALAWTERLLSLDRTHLYGLIRYTRFLDSQRALAILETTELAEIEPIIGLERLRRRLPDWNLDRIIPETWLLLNRSPDAAPVYQWAGYYFDFQKQYGEAARLLRAAKNHGIDGPWLGFHQSMSLIHDGKFDEGEALLRRLEDDIEVASPRTTKPGMWQIPANIGRLMEARRANAAALDYYDAAAAQVKDAAAAAKIQYRKARCLRALGRDRESRSVLEYGLSLDGENMNIRLELRRLNDLGIF